MQTAWCAARVKGTYLRALFGRLKVRRGPRKAIIAAVYWMLRRGVVYADLGADHFDRTGRTRLAARLARKLDELGFDVTLTGSSGKLCGLGQERDAGLTMRAMATPLSPSEGMAVRVPVVDRLRDGFGDLIPGLEATPGQGERAQHLPPRLDEVEVGGVFRLEHHLPARGVRHGSMRQPAAVDATATGDRTNGSNPQRQARGGAGVRPDR